MRASDEVCEVSDAGFLPSCLKWFLEIPSERPQIRGELALLCATIGMCELFKDAIQKFAILMDIQISDWANGSESQERAPANESRHCSASPPSSSWTRSDWCRQLCYLTKKLVKIKLKKNLESYTTKHADKSVYF